MPEKHCVCAKQ